MDMGMGMEGEGGRPPNPRFGASGAMGGMETMDGPPDFGMDGMELLDEDTDFQLLNWIYVDRDGTPLSAEDVEMSPDTKMTHLVPFVFRGEVDQRKLDLLLRTFASQAVPIDVRQIRINPEGGLGESGEFGSSVRMPSLRSGSMQGEAGTTRKYDLDVELRGSIALATRPDPEYLGLDQAGNDIASPLADSE